MLLVIALVMALSSVACSNSGGSDKAPTPPPGNESPAAPVNKTGIENAYPIGTGASGEFTNRAGVTYSVIIQVDEVIRGEAALAFINDEMLAQKSFFTAVAPTDETQEYIVAKITYTLVDYSDEGPRRVSTFYTFSETGEQYPTLLATSYFDSSNGYPGLSQMSVEVGETVTGYEVFQVSKSDPAPLIAYEVKLADLSDGLWFRLY